VRLLVDENVPVAAVRALRTAGHDVVFVTESHPGLPDIDVAKLVGSRPRPVSCSSVSVRCRPSSQRTLSRRLPRSP
jgi:hypothetical protein